MLIITYCQHVPSARRVIIKSGVDAVESSGDLVDFRHINTFFKFDSGYHLRYVIETTQSCPLLLELGFIQPGKPTQNAFIESLNGKFRNECLNQHWFRTLEEARYEIDRWRKHYNTVRPHSSLSYLPPIEFAKLAA